MASEPTIQINTGAQKTLATIDASAAVLETQNQGKDQLSLTLGDNFDWNAFATAFDKVTLRDALGNKRFVGWLDQRPQRAVGKQEGWQYKFTGPWRFLDMVTYKQRWGIITDPTTVPPTVTYTD